MDRIIDQAWASLLAGVLKKREVLRTGMGDDVDLYLPQSRLISLTSSNPEVPKLIYPVARNSAERNARNIVRKLGMPADYFWKFEYWPKARALTNLGQIMKRVFSSMMIQAKEGDLEITDIDVDPLRISVDFGSCVECAGLAGLQHRICFYHGGAFAGILSGLINRELDGFETACIAAGDTSCRFTVGDRSDNDIKTEHSAYLSQPGFEADLASRLEQSLRRQSVRTAGNLVDVNYYRLILATMLLSDPERNAKSNFEVGVQLGSKLAPVLSRFYGRSTVENMKEYYSQLGELKTEVKSDEIRLELLITECAETLGPVKVKEMLSFLLGEMQGLGAGLSGKTLILQETLLDGEKLLVKFSY